MNFHKQVTGRIHSTDSFGAVDGPGVRFVVFLQGCPLRCLYCHNPDSWDFREGSLRKAGELVEEILDYKSFIQKGGVTISGGEPLAQPEFTLAILTLCHKNGLHTALDTSGAVPLSIAKPCVDRADLLLLDIKALDPTECESLTGQSNQNALDLLQYCESIQKPVWIRHVCVPGYTLQESKLTRLAEFLKPYRCVERIELIPFHQMGSYKWDYLHTQYLLSDVTPPSDEEMAQAREIFKKAGLTVV